MIIYRRVYFDLQLLPRIYGSAIPRSILFAVAGAVETAFLCVYAEEWSKRQWVNITCFTVFSALVSFWVVFRCSLAYSRYWEGGCLKAADMSASFASAASLAAAFDGVPSDPGGSSPPGHTEFVGRLAHLLSLLHALIFMHLRGDWDLDNITKEDLSEQPPPVDPAELSNIHEVFHVMDLFMLRGTHEHFIDYNRATPMRVIGGLLPGERRVLEPLSGKTHSNPTLRYSWPVSWDADETAPAHARTSCSSAGRAAAIVQSARSAAESIADKLPKPRRSAKSLRRPVSIQFGTAPYQFGRCSRVQTVYRWINRHLAARIKSGGLSSFPAPVVAQIYPSMLRGYEGFESMRKLVDVPFPFPAAQLLTYSLLAFCLLLPIFFAGAVEAPWLAATMTFVTIMSYWGVNECARDLEDVTVLPPNEIPMARLQYQFNERLAVLLQPWGAEDGDEEDAEQPPLREVEELQQQQAQGAKVEDQQQAGKGEEDGEGFAPPPADEPADPYEATLPL